jgi:hypothetical protein
VPTISTILYPSPNISADPMKKNEMGGAWGTGEMHTVIWWENPREGCHVEDPDVDGKLMLK